MTRFTISDLPLDGPKLIERQRLGDPRGYLSRLFCADELATAGWHKLVTQITHTLTTRRGTVRGMHYQTPPHAEMKLVTCIRGEVWDVAVDLRAHSPNFLQWHAQILSADNGHALLIPEGFAHGFCSLTNNSMLHYKCTNYRNPNSETGIIWNDKKLNIKWPIKKPILSSKDKINQEFNKFIGSKEFLNSKW